MTLLRILTATALFAAGTVNVQADEPGAGVIVKRAHARKHVIIKTVAMARNERDGAVLFSGKVMSREYAYPRLSPGLLTTPVAIAYGYSYAPDYGFAYRLAPPVSPAATCVADPQLVYNTRGEFVGYGEGLRCY